MFCQNCPKREKCQKACQELENYLNRKESNELIGIKRKYSDAWIRQMEIPYDPDILDKRIVESEGKMGKKKSHSFE